MSQRIYIYMIISKHPTTTALIIRLFNFIFFQYLFVYDIFLFYTICSLFTTISWNLTLFFTLLSNVFKTFLGKKRLLSIFITCFFMSFFFRDLFIIRKVCYLDNIVAILHKCNIFGVCHLVVFLFLCWS